MHGRASLPAAAYCTRCESLTFGMLCLFLITRHFRVLFPLQQLVLVVSASSIDRCIIFSYDLGPDQNQAVLYMRSHEEFRYLF